MVTKSTRTAAQQEAVIAARAAKATANLKATLTATPEAETEVPHATMPEFKFDWKHLLIGTASWKRAACAMVASLATSAAVGYLGGFLLAYLTIGAAMLTGSLFITMLIYVLGILLIAYLGYRSSMYAYVKVIDKTVDAKCSAAYNWAADLFTSKKVCAS